MGTGVVGARIKQPKREINLLSQCSEEINMNEADLLIPSRYGQGKVCLYHYLGGQSKYITLFKNKGKFMSMEINIGAIRVFMKVGGRDPKSRVCGSLNDINTARVSLVYLHNRH